MSSPPTRFDPIIQAVARRAETIYSKMGIRRDESEDLGRKKKGSGEDEASAIPWEDTTEVSIVALRGFLEDLLGLNHAPIIGERDVSAIPPPPPTPPEHAVNPGAARAANAYQSMGRIVHDRNVEQPAQPLPPPPPSSDRPTSEPRLGDDFSDNDKEQLRGYINAMTELEHQGVEMLTLRRSLTFLESIHQAIKDAK